MLFYLTRETEEKQDNGAKNTARRPKFPQGARPAKKRGFLLKNRDISVIMGKIKMDQVIAMEKQFLLSQWNLRIPCTLTEPEDGDIRRVVLGVHGLGGSSVDEIQSSLAEEMELFYSATLRFDFPSHGKNPMDDSAFTLRNCVDSLLAVAKWGKEHYPQVEDLCIFATGFGAYVTLIALPELLELPGRVKLVVQTPSLRMHETLLAMKNITRENFMALGAITIRGQRPFEIPFSFYQELQNNVALTTHPIPILILHGEDDAYIRMSDIHRFRRINEQSKLVIIPGVTHRFLEPGAWDMVLDLTRDWFEFEQVLCCDWE